MFLFVCLIVFKKTETERYKKMCVNLTSKLKSFLKSVTIIKSGCRQRNFIPDLSFAIAGRTKRFWLIAFHLNKWTCAFQRHSCRIKTRRCTISVKCKWKLTNRHHTGGICLFVLFLVFLQKDVLWQSFIRFPQFSNFIPESNPHPN